MGIPDFIGTGARLTADDIAREARGLGIAPAALQAVVAVEARGRGFDAANRPTMLFEPHVFYRNLAAGKRAGAISAGLAWESWRPGHYPATADARYEQLRRAMAIDSDAALKACSWGLGQVLGENHYAAGFETVDGMVRAALSGEAAQLSQMVAFIRDAGLDRALRRLDWAAFAKGYNGPSYAKNSYDTKLRAAYRRALVAQPIEADPLADGVLSVGDKGAAVRELQVALGLSGVHADGDFGPMTRQAVARYQSDHRLEADGVVGPRTGRALGLAWARVPDAPAPLVASVAPEAGWFVRLIRRLFWLG